MANPRQLRNLIFGLGLGSNDRAGDPRRPAHCRAQRACRKARTMKEIILAVTLFSLALAFGCKHGSIKQVELTPQTLASQSADKPLLIDLTRTGTVYNVADNIDYSRVRVLFATGEMGMSDLARKLGMTGSNFQLGAFSDLSGPYFGQPPDGGISGGTSNFTCSELLCVCTRFRDCDKMHKAGVCTLNSFGCKRIPGQPTGCACLNKAGF